MGEHPLFAIDVASGEAKKLVGDGTISSFEIAGPTLAFSRNSMKTGNQLFTTGMDAAQLRAITPSAGEMVPEATFADLDRKSVVSGKSVSVRVDLGGRRIIKKKNKSDLTFV